MSTPFETLRFEPPFVVEQRGSKSLHFTLGELQSRMSLARPDDLQVDYTRTMMGFLLLNPTPQRITMIGLGGGSLVKFCLRYLACARLTVVEVNPHVIALRDAFCIPPDGERLQVVAADGADYIRNLSDAVDVLLVDGFDVAGQPGQLCSAAFYADCFEALAAGGVMVVNLHADHPMHEELTGRIAEAFHGNAVQILAAEKGNCVILARKGPAISVDGLRGSAWRNSLSAGGAPQLGGEFARIGWEATRVMAWSSAGNKGLFS